jgi:hypothetical protein
MRMASQRQRIISPSPRPKRLVDDRRPNSVLAPLQHRRRSRRGANHPKPAIAVAPPPRSRHPVESLDIVGLAIVGVTIVAVAVPQVLGLGRELAAVMVQPNSVIASAHPRHGDVPGPGFHVEDPEERAELSASTRVISVFRGLRAPTVNAADGITDLISLA